LSIIATPLYHQKEPLYRSKKNLLIKNKQCGRERDINTPSKLFKSNIIVMQQQLKIEKKINIIQHCVS
jgi:hypothetical protein